MGTTAGTATRDTRLDLADKLRRVGYQLANLLPDRQADARGQPGGARNITAHHPIAAFVILCLTINLAVILPPLGTVLDVLPLGPHGSESVGTLLGVTGAALPVTAAARRPRRCA